MSHKTNATETIIESIDCMVNRSPRVSIILPTYNHLPLLDKAINSVLSQTFGDFELIVVNDGSTDGTKEYLDSMKDSRIRVIHQGNKKLPTALNAGFEIAKGKYLTWVSSDNYLSPVFLEKFVEALENNPQAGLAHSAFARIDESDNIISVTRSPELDYRQLLFKFPGMASFMYRRCCQDKVGLYDASLEGAEDWDMWLRIVEHFELLYIPDVLYYYRHHEGSMSWQIPDAIATTACTTFENAAARLPLDVLYPSLRNAKDRKSAELCAYLDFATEIMQSKWSETSTATRIMKRLFTRLPDSVEIASNLAVAMGMSGRWDQMEPILAVMRRSNNQIVMKNLCLLEQARQNQDIEMLKSVVIFKPDEKEISLLKGDVNKQPDKTAHNQYDDRQTAIKNQPRMSCIEYFNRSLEEYKRGKFESAYELMNEYRTTVDYRSLPRFVNREKAREVDVSVIIVTYNRTEDVRKCIESVERQNIPREEYEIIVVDNGLTDENIIKPLCEQYIKCPANLLLSEGRNIGACFAKGRILAFLDDDALVGTDYIGSIKQAFDEFDIFGFRGKVLPKTDLDVNNGADNYDRGNEVFCTFCDQEGNSAFLTEIYLDTNGMDPLLFGAEGSDLSYRIGQKYKCFNKIIYWPRAVIYHDTTAGAAKKARQELYKLNEKYLNLKLGISLSAARREVEKKDLPVRSNVGNEPSVIVQNSKRRHRFSFVMIVLNGMPFIEYSLKSIYDFAHEIIIVEGAVEGCFFAANPDGSSTDGTVEFLKSFPDPSGKIKLIQGKWPEKCEMHNEALKHVSGDYVWLIDSDEVYKKEDLEKLRNNLKDDPSITQVNFLIDNFWKGLDYIFTSQKFYDPRNHCRRVFKYVPGAVFTTHRPPTMVWPGSEKTTEEMKLLSGSATKAMGIKIYHYSYVLDKQVKQKIELYRRYGWGKHWGVDLEQWYIECFQKWRPWNREQIDAKYPIWTGDKNSHTEPFKGTHPEVMMDFVLKAENESSTSRAMEHVIATIRQLKNKFTNENILAIETGTIRSFYEKHFSTYHISRSLGKRGRLISVDISEDSLRVSRQLCRGAKNIEFVQSDSIEYLSRLDKQKFHFALLDSVNDEDFIFKEFRLIVPNIIEGGVVIIDDAGISADDCQIDTSVPAQKGHRVWEFIQSCGLKAELLMTPFNHGTQIKIEMTADNIQKVNAGLSGSGCDVRKVIIIRSDSIGDLILFGGSFKYYKQLYPNSHITLVVTDAVGNLAEANPYIDEIITFNRTKMAFDREYAGQFIRQIQTGKYDVAICPAHSRDRISDFITINSGAVERITTSGDTANQTAEQIEKNNKYFTKILSASDGIELETFRNEEFLRNLGANIEDEYATMAWLTKDDIDFAETLLKEIDVQNPVFIAPFAQSSIRDWHIESWAKLISCHKDVPIVICGLEKDRTSADKIISLTGHPNVHNLCGKTSVRQLAALISRSRLCVSPESAAAHLAAATGCPHVVLIGGGHFGRFMPYSELTTMVYKKMGCYNCNWRCRYGKNIKCIKDISFEIVENAVRSILGTGGERVFAQLPETKSDNRAYEYLVSAVVSTCNSEKFIRGCLEDLENQTIADRLEIIVVDSGSEQNEKSVVKEFQQRYENIKYIRTEQRETVYQAWNRAIKAASGKYIAVANTDDRRRTDAIEVMANILETNRDIALVYADQYETSKENETFENVTVSKKNSYPDFEPDVFIDIGWCNIGSQPMWRVEIHQDVGYFDERFEIAGDYDFLLRVCEKYRCFHISQILGTFYRSVGRTVSCSNKFRLARIENPLSKARSLVRKGVKCIERAEYSKGTEYLQRSMQCWPSREADEYIQIADEKTGRRAGTKADVRFDCLASVWDWPREMSPVKKVAPVDRKFNDAHSSKYRLCVVIIGCNFTDDVLSCFENLASQSIADQIQVQVVSEQMLGCRAAVEGYENRFADLSYVEANRGENIWTAVNRALKSSDGRFVTILRPEYKYKRTCLEEMVKLLERDITKAGAYISAEGDKINCENNIKLNNLLDENHSSGRLVWRYCLHDELGWFDEVFSVAAEYEFWHRAAQEHCFARLYGILEKPPSKAAEYNLELSFENGLVRKVYQYARLCSIHIDKDGISYNKTFSGWFEINILIKNSWERLHGREYDTVRKVEDKRRSNVSPSLSVIIVTYDRNKALAQSLKALAQQSESNFEVIIVNNGSSPLDEVTHDNLDVCRIELDKNYGPSFARNVGAAHSRSRYIAFLDDDAVADCDFVKNVIRHFETDNVISLRGKILSPCSGYVPDMYDLGDEAIPYAADMEGNCAFSKDVFVQANGFCEWLFHGEGMDLSYRIFKKASEDIDRMFYFPDVIIYHQPYGNQLYRLERVVRADFMEKLIKEKNPGIERYLDFMFNFYPVNRKDIENKLGRIFNNASFLLDKKPDRALEWAKMARRNFPDALGLRFILGSAYFKLGDFENARNELYALFMVIEEILAQKTEQSRDILAEKKESIADVYLQTVSRLSQCCSRLGDYSMVRTVYERALRNTEVEISTEQRAGMEALLKKLKSMPLAPVPAAPLGESVNISEAKSQKEYVVSAVVSTYNAEQFIYGCLEDLENQTIADQIEIIVVNSGSEQNEEAIVREFQEKYDNIVYIKTERREGVYSAWNRAIKAARGRFLTNANTDDRHRRDALEILSNELINNPEIALVYADQICTDMPNATFEKHNAIKTHPQPDYTRERLLQGCCVGSQPMWRSSLHNEFGYFDEILDCAGDWDFWLRVSKKYNFKRIPEFLGLYYFNREGIEHGNMFHSYYERYAVGKRYGTEYISNFNTYETKKDWFVSVILPAYNAEKYIRQAIESVLIQNYRHFELVIINDGSTDKTEEIIRSYKDEHIRYFKQKNRGLAATHNEGIRQSRGEFLIKVDADDFIAVDFIGRHLNEFYNHRDADLVYCDDYLVEEDCKPVKIIKRPEYADRRILIRDLFRAGFPVVPFRTCINRRVFEKIGLFDESLRIGEDYDMMKRFVKVGLNAQHLKAALYYRRMTCESLSRQYSINKARAHFGIVKSYAETFSHDELFPGVRWELIPSGMRQLHFKCLVAMNFISLGRTYIETNLPNYARAALESAGEQLRNCLEIDPDNDSVKKLIDRCQRLEENLPQDVLIGV